MDGNQIQEVTSAGLVYLGAAGQVQVIDFLECYENNMTWYMNPDRLLQFQMLNNLTDEQLQQSIERYKQAKKVGERDRDSLYIEFYTEPPIRFQFSTKDMFDFVVYKARKAGWHTTDLT